MSNIVLSLDLSKTITDAVAAVEGAARKMQSSIDALVAGGMRSTDFVSPKSKEKVSTASPELFEAVNSAIVAGFSPRVRKLLAAPTKALSDTDKADKRYWQQQIGARRADFEKGLAKREGVADTRAPQTPKSAEEKIRAMIESIEKIVQGATDLSFDAADFLKALRDLNKMVK
jgi:hypothetical protein